MKLRESLNKHKDDKPIRKNNKYFYEQQTVFCIRDVNLLPDPFKDSQFRWEIEIVYHEDDKRQSGKLTFKSEEGRGKWDGVFQDTDPDTLPDHNWRLVGETFTTKDGREITMYTLEPVDQDESQCPCKVKKALPWQQNGHTELAEPEPSNLDSELAAMGFEPIGATEDQLHQIEVLSAALRVKAPAVSSYETAEKVLLMLRQEHAKATI